MPTPRQAHAHRLSALLVVLIAGALASLHGTAAAPGGQAAPPPNVVVILTDDQGYGDVAAFNPASRIPTPHIDQLAREGMRFTDAHTSSSVCTPTRYALLTGRYSWRTSLKKGVLWGNGDALIEARRPTIASVLKARGYHTAAVGKWHLGIHWAARPGAQVDRTTTQGPTEWIDYTQPFSGGPLDVGFDEFFGIAASLDMRDYVYLEGNRVVEPPTANLPGIPQGVPGFHRPGAAAPSFRPETVIDEVTARAVRVIETQARASTPFFLYVPFAAPHTPMLPTGSFVGRTPLGPYGDFVAQTDAAVGTVLAALARTGQADRTLVIFASDNGPAPAGGIAKLLDLGHDAAGGWRGTKHTLYEGGTRVPFVVRWPGVVKAGSVTRRTVVITDVLRTVADAVGAPVSDGAEDSVSFLPVLRDPETSVPLHEAIVMQSDAGAFAIRQGKWKLLLAPGDGRASDIGAPPDGRPPVQLYDLDADPKETTNLQAAHPEVVKRLQDLLARYERQGRSR
ncbi:arylsulfatase [Luteitalea sp. TBR-22]|uniref:sulfatase-like hydrolase/transferase n=1 Tax=Luteitalea sp. TBR-22 TaxID=2802971 RepID=UPI001AF86897|nr:sulfatase-like hydrolase/transferase [Luteitalea sp. TBR-22]BCS31029.1 arylsulfatase [Luteitalea sp. TBR-22]